MKLEPLLFINCPFCGSHAAKICSHEIKTAYENGLGDRIKHKRYYTRCMVCNARGPLAQSENLALTFWNAAQYDSITRNRIFQNMRYQK